MQSLGYYVGNSDGTINDTHQIAIFTTNGTLVGSGATLSPGIYTSGMFAYVAPSGGTFTLTAGTQYVVAANNGNGSDIYLSDNTTVMPGAGIASIDSTRYSSTNSPNGPVDFPTNLDAGPNHAYAGPNFQLVAAPEPSAFTALGLGALGLMSLVARRRCASLA